MIKVSNWPYQGQLFNIIVWNRNKVEIGDQVFERKPQEFYHVDFCKRIANETKVFVGLDANLIYELLCGLVD